MTAPEQVASAAQEQAGAVAGTAKEQAASVAQTATTAASDVTGTAKEQVGNVVGETVAQAKDLTGQVKEQVGSQVAGQTEKLTGTLRSLGGQISEGDTSGVVGQVLGEVGQRVQAFADKLEQTGPQEMLEEVRDYARRNPGTFLLGAAVAGLVAGRLVKGLTAEQPPALPAATSGTAGGNALAGVTQPGIAETAVVPDDVYANGGFAPVEPAFGATAPAYDDTVPAFDPAVGATPYPVGEPTTTTYETGASTYGTRGAL